MKFTYDESYLSDLHKEARGYRPREGFWAVWNEALPAGKQLIWDNLCADAERALAQAREEEAIIEARIQASMVDSTR